MKSSHKKIIIGNGPRDSKESKDFKAKAGKEENGKQSTKNGPEEQGVGK
jgi:hypothetical protein